MSALVTLNGDHVLGAEVTIPRLGAWSARATVRGSAIVAGPASLAVGGVAWLEGYAYRAGSFAGHLGAMLTGGRGGRLDSPVTARAFRPTTASVILGDTLAELGEALSPTSDAATIGRALPRWTRLGASGGRELDALADELGAVWRVADDGGIYFGPETWAAIDLPDRIIIAEEPARRRLTLAGSRSFTLRPGRTFEGRKITRVVHRFAPESVRSEIEYE